MNVQEVSVEIVKSPCDEYKVVKLGVLDKYWFRSFMSSAFFFKNENGNQEDWTEKLIYGLKIALREYPEVAGNLEFQTNDCYLHYNNQGVKIIKSKANFSFADVEKSNYDMNILPESQIFPMEYCGMALEKDIYLFVAHIIVLTDNSFLLVSCVHHVLCDGSGQSRLLNAWASATKNGHVGKYINETDRSVGSSDGKPPTRTDIEIGMFVKPDESQLAFPEINLTSYYFNVSFDKLDELKSEFSKGLPSGKYLSKNDVLTAIMWKGVVEARKHKKIKDSLCTTIVDARKILGIPKGHIGNVAPFLCQRFSTDEILKMSAKEMAWKIRELYSVFDKDYIMEIIRWFEQQKSLSGIMPRSDIFGNDIMFSSLAKHPFFEIDFGLGKPRHYGVAINSYTPGFGFILPTLKDDSWNFRIGLDQSEMDSFLEYEYIKKYCKVLYCEYSK